MLVVMLVVINDANEPPPATMAASDVCTKPMSARYTLMRLELALGEDPVSGLVGIAAESSQLHRLRRAGRCAAVNPIR